MKHLNWEMGLKPLVDTRVTDTDQIKRKTRPLITRRRLSYCKEHSQK